MGLREGHSIQFPIETRLKRTPHSLGKSLCSSSMFLNSKWSLFYYVTSINHLQTCGFNFRLLLMQCHSLSSFELDLLVQVLHPKHVRHRRCHKWVSKRIVSAEWRVMIAKWCQRRWNQLKTKYFLCFFFLSPGDNVSQFVSSHNMSLHSL